MESSGHGNSSAGIRHTNPIGHVGSHAAWIFGTSPRESRLRKHQLGKARFDELLLVLDGVLIGKSHRQIAIDLYGKVEIDAEWYDGSAVRGRVRRRVRKALYLMNGGYRDFLIDDG